MLVAVLTLAAGRSNRLADIPDAGEPGCTARVERTARHATAKPFPSASARAAAEAVVLEDSPSESDLVLDARRALRKGNAAEALVLVGRARSLYPGGGLAQERDALEIDALVKNGARDAAQRRAHEFLRRYPNSPYAENLASLLK